MREAHALNKRGKLWTMANAPGGDVISLAAEQFNAHQRVFAAANADQHTVANFVAWEWRDLFIGGSREDNRRARVELINKPELAQPTLVCFSEELSHEVVKLNALNHNF